VSVLAEPRFRLLAVEHARVEIAFDENEKPLKSPPPEDERKKDLISLKEMVRQDFQHTAEVLLQRSSERTRTIRRLRGTIPVKVVVERKPVVVTEKFLESKGTRFQIGGETLEITQAEQTEGGQCYVRLAVPPDRDGIRTYWHKRIHLEDARGNRYRPAGHGTSSSGGEHHVMVDYARPEGPMTGRPTRLIIEDQVTLTHPIPFEFKEVPLP
jgi:hypothetical protein